MGKGTQTDEVVLLHALKSCIKSKDLAWGKHVHAYMVITRVKPPTFFLNLIVDMYAKCGSLQDACAVFARIHMQDVVSWNIMLFSHARHGDPDEAVQLYKQMELLGLLHDHITYLGILDVGATLGNLGVGTQIHVQMVLSGLKLSTMITNALMNMYSKCGRMDLACKVFDGMDDRDVVSWNTILSGHAMLKDASKVLEVFHNMEKSFLKPDGVSYLSVLNACASLGNLEQGKQVHAKINGAGIMPNVVIENTLLDMYMKCGSIDAASQLFCQMIVRNEISWTVIISAHSTLGIVDDALFLFQQMQCEGLIPNDVTILSILCACSSSVELKKGKQIHASVIGSALDEVLNIGNAMVDMYFKCGSLTNARRCFNNMKIRDMITWNTMVSGYAKHGQGKEVLELVQQIIKEGFQLGMVTLACALSACSRAGFVAEGLSVFDSMERENGIIPSANHYACMVDLLGRAGHLQNADDFYKHMPNIPNLACWRTLLGACRIHADYDRAKAIVKSTAQSQPRNAEALETLSNMHSFLARTVNWSRISP